MRCRNSQRPPFARCLKPNDEPSAPEDVGAKCRPSSKRHLDIFSAPSSVVKALQERAAAMTLSGGLFMHWTIWMGGRKAQILTGRSAAASCSACRSIESGCTATQRHGIEWSSLLESLRLCIIWCLLTWVSSNTSLALVSRSVYLRILGRGFPDHSSLQRPLGEHDFIYLDKLTPLLLLRKQQRWPSCSPSPSASSSSPPSCPSRPVLASSSQWLKMPLMTMWLSAAALRAWWWQCA